MNHVERQLRCAVAEMPANAPVVITAGVLMEMFDELDRLRELADRLEAYQERVSSIVAANDQVEAA